MPDSENELKEAFTAFDADGDGKVLLGFHVLYQYFYLFDLIMYFWFSLVSLYRLILYPLQKGSTTKSELHKILTKFGQNLTDQELDAVMAEVDTDGDGVISFSEFKKAMEA